MKVTKLQSVRISWFLGFLVSELQRFKNISLEDVVPMLPNSRFMLSRRYWSHNEAFQQIVRRAFGICRSPSLPHIRFSHFQTFDMSTHNIKKNVSGFVLKYLRYLGVSHDREYWFWKSWTRPPVPKHLKLMDFRVFPKWILQVTSPERIRIITRSFRAILF